MENKNLENYNSDEKSSALLINLLSSGIDVTITITGNSMFPLWKHRRDTVVLTKCDTATLKKGDIPLYRRASGQYVMHRIVKVNSDSYNFCGDAQTYIECNMPKEKVIGVVKSFTRKGREYNCDNLLYLVYSTIWIWIFHIRRFISPKK